MKCIAFFIWVIPYGIGMLYVAELSFSIMELIGYLMACCGVGVYGLFIREVTKYVFQVHPIQTTIYVGLLSAVILPPLTILCFSIACIPMFVGYEGDTYAWIALNFLFGMIALIPFAGIGAIISLIACRALTPNSDRTSRQS
ncbi:hypothetical protein VSU19_18225 [Verrucomicrobiales bacterium BCK34]|nr:hypothetical protein [Verrucomicrobiales bacterium BCK34]